MPLQLKIPTLGESIAEVEIGPWLKKEGDPVAKDENLVVIESEKATVEFPAPVSGHLAQILKQTGERVAIGEIIALLETSPPGITQPPQSKAPTRPSPPARNQQPPATPAPTGIAEKGPAPSPTRISPAARRLLEESGLAPQDIPATGPGGRLLKEDVLRALHQTPLPAARPEPPPSGTSAASLHREEETVPMSLIRRTIAQRLVEAQKQAALLSTFNEIDMSAVMELRHQYKEAFLARYQIKLGFMSFFVKAAVDALKRFPQLNAQISGHNIVYHNYCDIGIAIGADRGLVVPVLRNAERMSFAEIEQAIHDFAQRAHENRMKPDDLHGGTFTISNGGVYGSLLSTPLVNPPQSGILGLHAIQDRPVVVDKTVVARPMMYIALTYDHRIVDGREAVSFLKRIKEVIETPTRLLMEI